MANLLNNFNIGQDVSIQITDDQGNTRDITDFGHLIDFSWKAETQELKVIPVTNGGRPIYNTIWQGVSGTFKWTRFNNAGQYFVIALMNNFYSLHLLPKFTIQVTVLNHDGSVDSYIATNAVFLNPSMGQFVADKEVMYEMSFKADNFVSAVGAPALPPTQASPLGF